MVDESWYASGVFVNVVFGIIIKELFRGSGLTELEVDIVLGLNEGEGWDVEAYADPLNESGMA